MKAPPSSSSRTTSTRSARCPTASSSWPAARSPASSLRKTQSTMRSAGSWAASAFMREMLNRGSGIAIALLLAIVASSIVMLLSHINPIASYGALLSGAAGSSQGLAETLAQTSTLLFAGLGVGLALRAGLFNIGAEGQLILGGLCAAVVGAAVHLPLLLEIPLCLIAGAFAGGVWAGAAGWLRAQFGASEIITTIMLNYIAIYGSDYLVYGPLRGSPTIPETAAIAHTAVLSPLIADTRLTL